MEPATIQEPAGFSDMSKAEQIRYLQALWDRIADERINLIGNSRQQNVLHLTLTSPSAIVERG